jgi:oxygen-independent coproporphyrinogen-3 oxidase
VLGDADLPVSTVFFGGGTPTLLTPAQLGRVLGAVRDEFGLAADAEVTTEANPESVDDRSLAGLRAAGFNRVSFGMQSVAPNVLKVLDRVHAVDRPQAAVTEARAAGFDHVNLDLIYGTPGERDSDWLASLEAVVATGVDHVSAYSLIVEDGTRLAGQVRRGELPAPSDDVAADRYLVAEQVLTAAGLGWYEVSNWALPGGECRHNLAYWQGEDWWGVGAGAHSHVGGVRWWNVRHPSAYTGRLAEGASPAEAREVLTDQDRRLELVMLGVRLAEGMSVDDVVAGADLDAAVTKGRLARLAAEGLVDGRALLAGRLVLTLQGRLLADHVVRTLLA